MSLKRKAGDVAADSAKKAKSNASITAFFGQPKVTLSSSATNGSEPASSQTLQGSEPASSPTTKATKDAASNSTATPTGPLTSTLTPPKFDKDAWVEKLTDEQKELLKLEINTLDESWLAVLKDDIKSPEFLDLKRLPKERSGSRQEDLPPKSRRV